MDEHELKHWGILNMKWGIRRFQNPDGSLTPEGRIRYGVGPAKKTGDKVGYEMTDDELKQMTNRYYKQANFYKARNEYIEAERRYLQLTAEPKKQSAVGQFLNRILLQPFIRATEKNSEFAFYAAGASILEESGFKFAQDYQNYVFRNQKGKGKNKENKNGGNNRGSQNRHDEDDDDDD